LQRRSTLAYRLTLGVLLLTAVCSVLRGVDLVSAFVLIALFAVMLPAHADFYRAGVRLTQRYSAGWFIAVVLVFGCTAWLMLFAYRDTLYNRSMWWQSSPDGDFPRSLRATAGALGLIGLAGGSRLLQRRPQRPGPPTADQQRRARQIAPAAPWSCLPADDLRLLIHRSETAVIGYARQGRSWIAMGDPQGDARAAREVAWDFREHCDDAGAWPVFYAATQDRLPLYVELGLTLIELNHESHPPPVLAADGRPKFLASPGGFALATILRNVTDLMARAKPD
jgi:phosphatidylglycerol lysyltransferase